jgi:3-hydroxybutyryl-CoA dehydrogenase
MGGGIAQSFALMGASVNLFDTDAASTQRHLDRLLKESTLFEAAGLFPVGATDQLRERLHACGTLEEAVSAVDFVEEAVFEDVSVKLEVLRRIDAAVTPGTIIGSNTSTIPVKVLAEAVADPTHFLTVHFSNPAPFIPGVELISGEATKPEIVQICEDLCKRMGRRSARVADVPGFVLNRLQYALLREALAVVDEGIARPQDVDTVVSTTFGFRLPFFGPFAIADMAGLDVYVKGFAVMEGAFGESMKAPKVLVDLVEQGHFGTKTGRGFYDLDPSRVEELITYRNTAYVRLQQLLDELGPSPFLDASGRPSGEIGDD